MTAPHGSPGLRMALTPYHDSNVAMSIELDGGGEAEGDKGKKETNHIQ